MKFIKVLSTMFVLLSLVQLTYALTGSIQPPRLIFRVNVTPSQTTTIESYFTVTNYNDIPVNIDTSSEEGLAEIDQDDLSFSLDVDEQRQVDFTIQISQPGEYIEGISVLFSGQGMPISLSGEIIIHASEGTTAETCDNADNDGNGLIDEDLIRKTTCGVGACAGNTGMESCTAGVWGNDSCDPYAGATIEICDGIDNDCDGETDEGCLPGYEELMQRIIALENQSCGSRLTILEQWSTTIKNAINAIESQLGSIEQWLFFWNYQEEGSVCDVVENECSGVCVEQCNEGDVGCIDEDTRWYCEMQQDGCCDKIYEDCDEGQVCKDGECNEQQEIECYNDNDCGTDYYFGAAFCKDNDVYMDYREYICWNPGMADSFCDYDEYQELFQDCDDETETCEDGECVPIPEIKCYNDEGCGTDGYIGSNYCLNDDVYRDYREYSCYNAGTENSYCDHDDIPTLIEECDYSCENGECLPPSEEVVIFRTNAVNGDYTKRVWISVDADKDNVLEGYKKDSVKNYLSGCNYENLCDGPMQSSCIVTYTPEGFKVMNHYYLGKYKPRICDNINKKTIYFRAADSSMNPVTSSTPTEPYASNGQEVYG